MKRVIICLFTFLFSILIYSQEGAITVNVEGIKNCSGSILYAVYDSEKSFNNEDKNIKSGILVAKKGSLSFQIKGLYDGVYAVSLFHDENNNKELDCNILGIPKEGFGFSQNPKIRFGAPSFSETKFEKRGNTTISIKMKYLL